MWALLCVFSLLGSVYASPVNLGDAASLSAIQSNLTALWEEVEHLKEEVKTHLHEGHDEAHHDQLMAEVDELLHEHDVHQRQNPHSDHSRHHNPEALTHLSEFHGPMHNHAHTHGHAHGQDHTHGHAHGQDHSHGQHSSSEITDDDSQEQDATTSGEDSHEDTQDKQHGHKHDHNAQQGPTTDQNHHVHHHDDHHTHEGEDGHDTHGLHDHHHHDLGGWAVVHCDVGPNTEVVSEVQGTITISQMTDGKSDVFYDIALKGFPKGMNSSHGIHVHENRIIDSKCSTAGGHYNPGGHMHGSLHSSHRHSGDLSNLEVAGNGEFVGIIKVAESAAHLAGPRDLIGKSIVIHGSEDDLGLASDAGSHSTGNAGDKVACCTIESAIENHIQVGNPGTQNVNAVTTSIRFNG